MAPSPLTLVGRSSSHFTRVARIFAAELAVPCELQVVSSLMSLDAADYGGHPALRMPSLRTPEGDWFGSLNVCRELGRRAVRKLRIVWPEDTSDPLLGNAQELTTQAMSTEVAVVLARAAGIDSSNPLQAKQELSLASSVGWLDRHADAALGALPAARDLSFLEVTLFCLAEHLQFREVLDTAPYHALLAFRARFAERESARLTAFRFD